MAGPSITDSSTTPLHTLFHLITIKLSSTNYLLWKNQVHPLLSYLNLLNHIDGTSIAPPPTITTNNQQTPNPAFATWQEADQRVLLLLQSSLTEEAMAETIGHTTARQVWQALENAYSHHSLERMHTLRDSLRQMQKGNSTVSDYGRKFRLLCDQLAAIGHPVTDADKQHWFLCGLGPSFEMFSISQRTVRPPPLFHDLLAHAENHEIFLQTLNNNQPPQAAFSAHSQKFTNFKSTRDSANRGCFRGSSSGGRGRSTTHKRPPHCQLCRNEGHYASSCPNLASYAQRAIPLDANIAQAFQAQCNIAQNTPDWTVDSGATAHMLRTPNGLEDPVSDPGSKNSSGPR